MNDTDDENIEETELTDKNQIKTSTNKSIPIYNQPLPDTQNETKRESIPIYPQFLPDNQNENKQNIGFDFSKYHIQNK